MGLRLGRSPRLAGTRISSHALRGLNFHAIDRTMCFTQRAAGSLQRPLRTPTAIGEKFQTSFERDQVRIDQLIRGVLGDFAGTVQSGKAVRRRFDQHRERAAVKVQRRVEVHAR